MASVAETITIIPLLNKINQFILNPIIILVFMVSLLMVFWGIFEFIKSETADTKRDEGKRKIIFGVVGMFVMFSAYGLIRLTLNTFGLDTPSYINR